MKDKGLPGSHPPFILPPLSIILSFRAPRASRLLPLRSGGRSGHRQYRSWPWAKGSCWMSRRSWPSISPAAGSSPAAGRGAHGPANARPHPATDLRRPPAGRRRGHGLRALRGHAPLLPPQGPTARLAAETAGARGRARQHYPRGEAGRVQQRPAGRGRPGVGHARGQGRRHRRRPARSPSRWPAWSATSAAARPRWP